MACWPTTMSTIRGVTITGGPRRWWIMATLTGVFDEIDIVILTKAYEAVKWQIIVIAITTDIVVQILPYPITDIGHFDELIL